VSTALSRPTVECDRALAVAHADAVTAYPDLSRHRVEVRLEGDGWHVEYTFRGEGRFHVGGGPHYLIDAETGVILDKKYYQ
jgi:hypothetical protein